MGIDIKILMPLPYAFKIACMENDSFMLQLSIKIMFFKMKYVSLMRKCKNVSIM